jgi:hypothetical protein
MNKNTIVIAQRPDCRVTIVHYTDDPLSWIVRKWVRKGLLRRRVESKWFNHRDAAEKFARSIALEK